MTTPERSTVDPETWKGLWAGWTDSPRPDSPAPRTGWIHEPGPPYAVLVSSDPLALPFSKDSGSMRAVPYTGTEMVRDWREYRASCLAARLDRDRRFEEAVEIIREYLNGKVGGVLNDRARMFLRMHAL